MPWVIDEHLSALEEPNSGITFDDLVDFVHEIKWEGDSADWIYPTEEWVSLDERFSWVFKAFWEDADALEFDRYIRPTYPDFAYGSAEMGLCSIHAAESFIYSYGETWEYWVDVEPLSTLLLNDHIEEPNSFHHIDYETAYAVFEVLGYPWILDTDFATLFDIAN